ncbi:AGL020Wp [Eremothecium gossypii ATCC 10895]|uniref:AGL020Wp n=1 Tax=Eremothecium gossypii (strain ATCC 10895 / CBS 109.51 / FGSC 9923 / NRRL Y-1056) TaxID=284811 RepID=Q750H3_EREGS|nr:AGL020Wp [Eremothecium gossypii ATCC 10895]AAS54470.1 AGL020Wp [Eremothecium gossypii ATCC 10895]AEY98802.1 FAGL020Wp [Eremothecium gossypii FDAG1]
MLFGVKLANDIYPPWKDWYIDYDGLKKLLKESVIKDLGLSPKESKRKGKGDTDEHWTARNESNFVEALDRELEKVYSFQSGKYTEIMGKLERLEEELDGADALQSLDLGHIREELEQALTEAQELDRFSRLNFTGFIKIVKKHDKLHEGYPSVKSLLQVRLKALPFHSEEYSPLLYKISFLYDVLRKSTDTASKSLIESSKLSSFTSEDMPTYRTYKFWIHPDNLMEVKTRILRHLPVLVYMAAPPESGDVMGPLNPGAVDEEGSVPSSASSFDATAHQTKSLDNVVTTLYFDNEEFELYNNRLLKATSSPTVMLWWTGKLINLSDVFLEKRVPLESKDTDTIDREEVRLKLKKKFISGFIFNGDPEFKEKMSAKLRERGSREAEISKFCEDVDSLQKFILQNELQPVLRTLYTRTAFQIPGDDRIRITIDSNIMYIREDCFDEDRPIRDPKNWHRPELDAAVQNPMKFLRPGEYTKFPYSVMEIRVRTQAPSLTNLVTGVGPLIPSQYSEWFYELTNSHLVKEVPKFSKYIQGVASLFGEDDRFDMLPFWLPDLETDIRMNPDQAYEEERKRLEQHGVQQAAAARMRRLSLLSHPGGASLEKDSNRQPQRANEPPRVADLEDSDTSEEEAERDAQPRKPRNRRKRSMFLTVLTGREPKLSGFDSEDEEVELPPGVKKPTTLIKNAGPVNVEAKVWLANERTFTRWLTLATSLSVLTFSIFYSADRSAFPKVANTLSYIYFGLTVFTALWAYFVHRRRLSVITERSGQHLDAPVGPLLLALVLVAAQCINFVAVFRGLAQKQNAVAGTLEAAGLPFSADELSPPLAAIREFVFWVVGADRGPHL